MSKNLLGVKDGNGFVLGSRRTDRKYTHAAVRLSENPTCRAEVRSYHASRHLAVKAVQTITCGKYAQPAVAGERWVVLEVVLLQAGTEQNTGTRIKGLQTRMSNALGQDWLQACRFYLDAVHSDETIEEAKMERSRLSCQSSMYYNMRSVWVMEARLAAKIAAGENANDFPAHRLQEFVEREQATLLVAQQCARG